jgi:hypothetical protein
MSSLTTMLPLPDVAPDVQVFAEKEGVAAYLPAVVAMTRRIFPSWPIKVFLEDDPEIANDWHIVLEVEVPGEPDVDRIVALDWQWSREIFDHCPSTHVSVFRLGMT